MFVLVVVLTIRNYYAIVNTKKETYMQGRVINKQLLLNKITAKTGDEISALWVNMLFTLYGRIDETRLNYSEEEEGECDTSLQEQITQTI